MILKYPYYTLGFFVVFWIIYGTIKLETRPFYAIALDMEFPRQAWRWMTYTLLHRNLAHILYNSVSWLLFSGIMEMDHGHLFTFITHIVSVLGGAYGVGWECSLGHTCRVVVGTSGGIYGLCAAQIGNIIFNWNTINIYRRAIYSSIVVTLVVTDTLVTVVLYDPLIAYSNHIGGFIFGLLMGVVLFGQWRPITEIILCLSILSSSINLLI
jgi:membrane associated rhomboid family serine protease